jgi:NCS1 family nucleobase:cation symporter-1
MPDESSAVLERRSIEHVPENERHGRVLDLFTLWFGSNIQVTAVVTGALAMYIGLDLKWAIITIVVGNALGGIFMAYHSVQGPRLGVPQMVQSRAQFGFVGAALPMAIAVVLYLGFATEGGLLAGQALAAKTGMPQPLGIAVFNAVLLVIALFGYNLIHRVSKVIAILCGLAFIAIFVALLTKVGSAPAHISHVTWPIVLLGISIFVAWQITWAPYVSDYSRYLPVDISGKKTFWFTYIGSVGGAILAMLIGVLAVDVGGTAFGDNAFGYLSGSVSGISVLLFIALMLSLIPAGAESPYGAFLTGLAIISARGANRAGTAAGRAVASAVFLTLATVLAIAGSAHMLTTIENITLFLLYLLVPWTAINLTDYLIVRRGSYNIDEFFKRDGEYGLVNWKCVALYLVTLAIEIPFVNSSLYEGPIAKHMSGADIAWLVGLAVSTVGYLFIARGSRTAHPANPGPAEARVAA